MSSYAAVVHTGKFLKKNPTQVWQLNGKRIYFQIDDYFTIG